MFHAALKISGAKRFAAKKYLKPGRSKTFTFPKDLAKELQVDLFLVKNRNVVTFTPKKFSGNKHLFFLHGGAFTVEAVPGHWQMIKKLVKDISFRLSFIDYPLAPEHTYKESHEMVLHSYYKLVEKFPDDEFYFLGDSAGGGLCLSIAQHLRDSFFKKMPEKLALLSPWLDVSLSNPEIKELEKKDLILDPRLLLSCSHSYAGSLDLKDPKVSPLYGDLDNLSNIGIFVGTHEILLPDCRLLKSKMTKSNTNLFYKEYEGMQHDWIIFPIKESQVLLNDVVDFLLDK